MKSQYSVSELVPHADRMSLLDKIVAYGDGWLNAEVKITPESLFADERGVPAWVGVEYMAQAIAAYAGLQERLGGGAPKIGFLLGTRKYTTNAEYFTPESRLSIQIKLDMVAENGLNVFACELLSGDLRAEAVINVFQPDDAAKFLHEVTS